MVEALIVTAIFGAVLLFFAHATFSSVRHGQDERHRTTILQLTREFTERLKADDEWPTLYERLRSLAAQANAATTHAAYLEDGRKALPIGSYYADIEVPTELGKVAALVEVPSSPPSDEAGGAPVLREDVTDAAWGLPFDLNGDGVIDSQPRETDYVALPVRITIRWQVEGRGFQELRRVICLGGRR